MTVVRVVKVIQVIKIIQVMQVLRWFFGADFLSIFCIISCGTEGAGLVVQDCFFI